MAGYVTVPVTTDWTTLAKNAITYLQQNVPGFNPNDNSLIVWAIYSFALMLSQSRDVASITPDQIFKYYGENIAGLPPIAAAAATATVTLTVQNNAGYDIPEGTHVGYALSGSNIVAFATTADAVVAVGQVTVAGVPVAAVIPGVDGNAVGPGAGVMIDSLAYVTGVSFDVASQGGVDAEDDTAYMNRLVAQLQLQAPRPILPNDFAVMARNIAGVARAIGIDGYNPVDATYNNERMVTVGLVDAAGNPVTGAVKANVQSYLEGMREINFVVNVVDPTITIVNVGYSVHILPGYDAATTTAAIQNALDAYLNPATWGGGNQDPPVWLASAGTVRLLRIAQVIEDVAGVDYVATGTLTLNGAAADVVIGGVAPLAKAGTISGTVI